MESDSIVIDSSALIAVLLREPGFERIERVLAKAKAVLISAATRLEVCIVMSYRVAFSPEGMEEAEEIFNLTVVTFSAQHAICAFEAFQRFGKGRHKAALNFGDCQTYATAKLAGLPLLFVGNDFNLTDLECVAL